MNSWKLLTALILTLALTNILVFAQENDVGVDDVVDSEDPTNEMVDDVDDMADVGDDTDNDDDDIEDAAQDAAQTICEAFDDGNEKRAALSKRAWTRRLFNKARRFINRKLPKIPKIPGLGFPIRFPGKRDVELDDQEKRELNNFIEAHEAISSDDKRSIVKRSWFRKIVKKAKGAIGKIWKEKVVPAIWKAIQGKRSIEGIDGGAEELNSVNTSPKSRLSKRGWRRLRKIWRKVKPYIRLIGKRSDGGDDGDDGDDTASKVEEVREALDVLNTAVDMAEAAEG